MQREFWRIAVVFLLMGFIGLTQRGSETQAATMPALLTMEVGDHEQATVRVEDPVLITFLNGIPNGEPIQQVLFLDVRKGSVRENLPWGFYAILRSHGDSGIEVIDAIPSYVNEYTNFFVTNGWGPWQTRKLSLTTCLDSQCGLPRSTSTPTTTPTRTSTPTRTPTRTPTATATPHYAIETNVSANCTNIYSWTMSSYPTGTVTTEARFTITDRYQPTTTFVHIYSPVQNHMTGFNARWSRPLYDPVLSWTVVHKDRNGQMIGTPIVGSFSGVCRISYWPKSPPAALEVVNENPVWEEFALPSN